MGCGWGARAHVPSHKADGYLVFSSNMLGGGVFIEMNIYHSLIELSSE